MNEAVLKGLMKALGVNPEEIQAKFGEYVGNLKTKVDGIDSALARIEEKLDKMIAAEAEPQTMTRLGNDVQELVQVYPAPDLGPNVVKLNGGSHA